METKVDIPRIVSAVLVELDERSGFDDWWEQIEPDVQVEIVESLQKRVAAVVRNGKAR